MGLGKASAVSGVGRGPRRSEPRNPKAKVQVAHHARPPGLNLIFPEFGAWGLKGLKLGVVGALRFGLRFRV